MVHARSLSTLAKIAASSLLILIFCAATLGQGSTPNRGFQPGNSYALSDIETINTTNGNLSLHLPLGQLPVGRGGFSGQLNLHYDSKLYDSKTQWYQDFEHLEFGNPHVAIRNMLVTSNEGGWHYGTGYELQLIDRMSQYPSEIAPQYPALETIYHYKVKVAFPDGSLHEFIPRVGSQFDQGYSDIRPDGYRATFNGSYVQDLPYLTNNVIYYTFDGSYVRLEVQHDSDGNWWNNPWTLTFPDGTRVTNFGSRITDRNGNYVEFSSVTYNSHPATQLMDQLGRKIIVEYGGFSGGDVIHVPGVGGADLTYQVYWKGIQIFKTYSTVVDDHFSPDGYPAMLASQFVVSRVDLPAATGGLQYLFGYNAADSGSTPCCTPSYGWGELSSVTLPSGAQAQYQYRLDGQNGPGSDYSWDMVLRNSITHKTLAYQQQYDGNSTPVTENRSYTIENGLTTIENPDHGIVSELNDTQRTYRTQQPDGTVIEQLYQANRPQGFPSTSAYDEYSGIDAYDPQRVNSYVKTQFTSIRDAGGTLVKTAIKDYNYDKNGNLTAVRDYDWVDYGAVPRTNGLPTGIPAGAVLKRVTTNTLALSTPDASDSSSNNANSYWNSTAPNLRNAVAATEVSNGSATLSRTEFTYDNAGTTGNLTQQKSWDSTKGAYSNPLTGGNSISVSTQYDSYGNTTLSTDARGYQTQSIYGSVGGFTDLYPTQVKTAYQTSVQRTETREYDFSTGVVTRTTDVDNNVATATTYDVIGRPTLVKAAEGKPEERRTSTTYSDVNRRVITKSDLNTAGDEKLVSIQHYDQLGRVRLTRQLEDAATQSATDETTGIKVQTRYQYSGNFSYVLTSNPYRAATSDGAGSETSMGWSRSKADNGGRVLEAQTFGGASAPAPWGTNTSSTGTVLTAYDANSSTVTDQAGKAHKSVIDALGRLTEVYEDPAGLNYQTSYLYDALDNLARVTQGSQQRFFMYDSLKRLIRADNPEQETLSALNLTDPVTSHSNWSAKYEYDNNRNLTFKTDARGVVTENRYDELNRLTTVLYRINGQPDPSTGDIQYVYDNATYGKGRLWLTYRWGAKPSHTAIGEYDAMGRVKQLWNEFGDGQGGWSAGYGISRNYNLAGQVTYQKYPSDRAVNYSYDAAGRTTGFTGNLGDGVTRTYASSFIYNARSQKTQELFGTQIPLYHKLQYNVRGQLWDVRVSTNPDVNGSLNRGGLQYFYDSSLGYGTSGSDNNGNVVFANFYTPEDEQLNNWAITRQRYNYDSLNRLKSVTEYFVNYNHAESQQSVQTYDYDRWGNRTINTAQTSGTGINNTAFEVETARNRLYSPGDLALSDSQRRIRYDQAGNQVKDTYTGSGTATFDGDNRIVVIQDKFGGSSTYTYNANSQRVRRKINNQETWDIYGIDGELVAEYAANGAVGAPQKEYGYRDGQLLITAASSSGGSISSGLVGYWKFDENSSTTAADASGNNNTGTLSSGAAWTTGQSGAATNLDGVDDYVQVGAQASLVMTNAGTLSAWIYPTGAGSLATYGGIIINKEGEYELARFQDGTIQWAFANTNPGWNWINTGYVAPLNQWTHVAVTYDAGVVKTYINGTLTHTYSGSGVISDVVNTQNDFRIGGRQGTSHNFQGRIDEVRAYNRALSGSEVTTLLPPPASGLKGNWKFDENSGTTAADASGNSNTGTLSSGAAWTTGQSGAATNLDGVDDYVQVGAQSSLVLTSAGTLSAWIYPTGAGSLAPYGGIILNKEGEYELARFTDGTIQWAFANTNPGWNWVNTGYVAPLNQWTHVAVTYDSGVVKTYINGTLYHTYSGSGAIGDVNSSQNDFRIGSRQSGSHNLQGRIDEVRVYNRALSATEVTTLPGGSSSSSAQINWLVPDHLGTPRIILDQTGAFANVKRHDYLPFGEELPAGTGGRTTAMGYVAGDGVRQQFTSKERDTETGLDFFSARYSSSSQGRFTSPDPLLASGRAAQPQSWNRYSYCINNPLLLIDPNGLAWYVAEGSDTPEWYQYEPPKGYKPWTEYNYWGGEGHKWVHLNRFSGEWSDGHESKADAASAFTISEVWSEFTEEVNKSWTWGNIKSDVSRAVKDPLGPGGLGDPAFLMLAAAPNPFSVTAAVETDVVAATNKAKSTVTENKIAGDAFRDEIADLMRAAGRGVETEVRKNTPFGPRTIDVEVSNGGQILGGIEVKLRNSRYLPSQRAKDWWLRVVENYPVNVVRSH